MSERLRHDEAIKKIREAHKKRGEYLYFIFRQIEQTLDRDRAEEIVRAALQAAGKYYGEKMGPLKTPIEFVENLKKTSHEETFNRVVTELNEEQSSFVVNDCPLLDAWKGLGLSDADVSLMCEIAMEVDFAIMEALGFHMKLAKSLGAGDTCCEMRLTVK